MKRLEKMEHQPIRVDSNALEISTLSLPRQESALEIRTKDSQQPTSLEFAPSWSSHLVNKNTSLWSNTLRPCRFCSKGFSDIRKVSENYLYANYEGKTQKTYNVNIVNDIVFNAQTHVVAVFKDYLIYDDIIEFLKKPYGLTESKERLRKACEFYDKYSKVFPNYITLKEKKYMFKNIERKQKMIDEKQRAMECKKEDSGKDKCKRLLTNNFIKDLSKTASKLQTTKVKKMGVQELLEKYIKNDSLSLLGTTRCEAIDATFLKNKKEQVAPVETILYRAENVRKKSIESQKTVTDAKKLPKPPSGTLNGMIFMQVPILPVDRFRRPEIALRPTQKNINWKLGVPPRRTSVPKPQAVVHTPVQNPLNININLNLVVNNNNTNKGSSRTATPQTCTASNLRRYRSLEKVGPEKVALESTNTLPLPTPMRNQKRIISHRPSGSHGILLKSRQDKARALATQKIYGNPILIPKKSAPKILVKNNRDDFSLNSRATGKNPNNPFMSPGATVKREILFPGSPRAIIKGLSNGTPTAKYTTKAMIVRGNEGRFSGSIIGGNPYDCKKPVLYHK